jgi:hypothetical protein
MNTTGGTCLEDVLDTMLAEYGAPTSKALTSVSRRYPEYRSAMLEFAAGWAEEEHLPAPAPSEQTDAPAVLARIRFAAELASRETSTRLSDLAQRAGSSLQELAAQCRLNVSLLMKIDAGRIAPNSVGKVLPSRLAELLGVAREIVVAAFAVKPHPVAAASFFGPAQSSARESFLEAMINAGTEPEIIAELMTDVE